jgi:two-component sensor histidine kinase
MRRWLHLIDHQKSVEFKQYLRHLCEDLSDLLFQGERACMIIVEGTTINIPAVFAIPLGFIVNELITNSAKYAKSNIIVRLETSPSIGHSISVLDNGPGLPAGFDPTATKGLGMKIVNSLVKQIGGELQITTGENGRGGPLYGRVLHFQACDKRSPIVRRGHLYDRCGSLWATSRTRLI